FRAPSITLDTETVERRKLPVYEHDVATYVTPAASACGTELPRLKKYTVYAPAGCGPVASVRLDTLPAVLASAFCGGCAFAGLLLPPNGSPAYTSSSMVLLTGTYQVALIGPI